LCLPPLHAESAVSACARSAAYPPRLKRAGLLRAYGYSAGVQAHARTSRHSGPPSIVRSPFPPGAFGADTAAARVDDAELGLERSGAPRAKVHKKVHDDKAALLRIIGAPGSAERPHRRAANAPLAFIVKD
jgi:hypothetical protein